MDKQIIIDDQKKTIHRLQQECTEKTNIIIALGNKLQAKEQECEKLRFPMKDTNYAILTKEEFEQFKQLKAENDELKGIRDSNFLHALEEQKEQINSLKPLPR